MMTKETEELNAEILSKRALAYRKHAKRVERSYRKKVCLSFSVCSQTCLLPLEYIASLQSNAPLTLLPNAPRGHLGLFSVRGTVHEVFCLNALADGESPSDPTIVTLQSPYNGLALALEKIEGTESIDPSLLLPLEKSLGPPGANGMTKDGTFFIQLSSLLTEIN